MKNTIIIILLFIPFLIISLIIFKQNQKEMQKQEDIYTIYPFYKEKYKNDYINYQKKNNLSMRQAILNVNIGLNHPFYENAKETNYKDDLTIIVNKYNYVSKDFIPNNLVNTSEYSKKGVTLQEIAYKSFLEMAHDIEKDNMHLRIISGYRSYSYQENLYNNYLKYDSQDIVDSYSARPGYSEHHTGLAIDIDNEVTDYNRFHITQEFSWMKKNAHKYGFILRYPLGKERITGYKYEPWHYRYVGKDIAQYIHDNDITYEEYYYQFID